MSVKDSGMLIRLAYVAMGELGIDADQVLARCNLDAETIADLQLRTPHAAQAFFWEVLEEVSADPNIGLHLGEKLPPFQGQVIEYLFLSSSTFGEGLSRTFNYKRLLSDAVTAQLGRDEHGVYLYNIFKEEGLRHLNEAMIAGLITFFKSVTDGAFKVSRVTFNHQSSVAAAEYQRVYGCPVVMAQQETRMYFSPDILDYPSNHAEPELLRLHEQVASDSLARLEKLDWVVRVKRIIAEVLESGQANLETVAAKLDLKPRLLRTRLNDAETNFNQVLADYRYQLAKRLLASTLESIDEIVYLTGFSEPSTFYRAFKRWEGLTPIEYRKQHAL